MVRQQRLCDAPARACAEGVGQAHRLGPGLAVSSDACRLSGGDLGGLQLGRVGGDDRAVRGAHVCHHRLLSSLFFASHLQDLARRAIHLRHVGRLGRAARPDLVGGASSPPSCPLGQAGRCALAGAARLFLEPHGLVHVPQALRGGFVAREGSAEVSRAAVPGSLRCRGSDGSGGRRVSARRAA